MESFEVGWPAIIDIFGTTRYSLYIYVNITVYKICWLDLGTFSVHVLVSDIFIEIYTHTLNDIFHTIVKNK
jgi:hypothetical protein